MFTMDTAFTVINKDVQINTRQVYQKDVLITVIPGDEIMLDTWTTEEDFG